MTAREANLDGLVGPTHNYAGLSFGNVASEANALSVSNPKQAALQGLRKMKFLHDLGIPQLVMPPQRRPHVQALKALGYDDIATAPADIVHKVCSASSMWTANAATVSPSADTMDGKVHFTPANLASNLHRSIEAPATARYLRQIFPGTLFVHHDPVPAEFPDEGAANHMRLCNSYGERGTSLFVCGGASAKYPARQSPQAQRIVSSLHGLDSKYAVFLRQNPDAIDAGVFHNDVIAMSDRKLLLYHEKAYEVALTHLSGFTAIKISEEELPIRDAVATYFFNAQLVTLPSGQSAVIAPKECEEHPKTRAVFASLMDKGHIHFVHCLEVRESMKNGGGPACLRLRVVLTEEERAAVHPHAWLSDALYGALCRWIEKHYRDRISVNDLRDRALAEESERAFAELSGILKIKTEM